jgi:pilus assembly protein CpaF/type IV secretion system protein VirB11
MAEYGSLALLEYEPIAELLGRQSWKGKLTELSINGPGDVWARIAGEGYVKVSQAVLKTAKADKLTQNWLNSLCGYFAAANGIRWTADMPLIACRTPDGNRFQALLGNNVESGMAVSIRVKRMVNANHDSFHVRPEWRDQIERAIRDGKSVICSGGTGSGKTTYLNFLLKKIEPWKRVITVEDTREVEVSNENRLHLLVSRTEGATRINYGSIIDTVLRLNPDVLLLGEVSIQNAFPLLQAWDTGHEGGLSTMHANSPLDALRGLRRRVALGGGNVGGEIADMMDYLADNVGLVIQIKHMPAQSEGDTERRMVTDVAVPKDLLSKPDLREAMQAPITGRGAGWGNGFDVAEARKLLTAANAGERLSSTQEEVLRTLGLIAQAVAAPASRPQGRDGATLSPDDETLLAAKSRGLLIDNDNRDATLITAEAAGTFAA